MTLAEINSISQTDFETFFARVLEHSPHYAAKAAHKRPFLTVEDLLSAFTDAIFEDNQNAQLELILAHPDLAGKAAILTEESASEQKNAGLDRLSPAEFAEFTRVNTAYCHKFQIPYIVCVRENSKESILAGAAERLEHTHEQEILAALREIGKIAKYRILDLVS